MSKFKRIFASVAAFAALSPLNMRAEPSQDDIFVPERNITIHLEGCTGAGRVATGQLTIMPSLTDTRDLFRRLGRPNSHEFVFLNQESMAALADSTPLVKNITEMWQKQVRGIKISNPATEQIEVFNKKIADEIRKNGELLSGDGISLLPQQIRFENQKKNCILSPVV